MSITSVLVGSLQQGGGLDWQSEVFPRRILSWDGDPTEESFTVPGDKPFIAFAAVHVFSGGHPDHLFYLETEEQVNYRSVAGASGGAPGTGTHRTGLIGLQPGASSRTVRVIPILGYDAPDLTYQVSIWWAELPEDPEV